MFVHGEADGGFVHDGDMRVGQSFVIAELIKFDCIREFGGVLVVDAVNLRCFYDNIALHFQRQIERGGVSGQEGPASATGYDDDAALFDMTQGAAVGILINKLIHLNSGEGAGRQVGVIEHIRQRDGVHQSREHADVVG